VVREISRATVGKHRMKGKLQLANFFSKKYHLHMFFFRSVEVKISRNTSPMDIVESFLLMTCYDKVPKAF